MKPTNLFYIVIISIFTIFLHGCSDTETGCTNVEDPEGFVAEISDHSNVLMYNNTDCSVRYFAADREVLTRINPGPYQNTDAWPTVPAGEAKEIPFARVNYFSERTNDILIRWNYRNGKGDSILINLPLSE